MVDIIALSGLKSIKATQKVIIVIVDSCKQNLSTLELNHTGVAGTQYDQCNSQLLGSINHTFSNTDDL